MSTWLVCFAFKAPLSDNIAIVTMALFHSVHFADAKTEAQRNTNDTEEEADHSLFLCSMDSLLFSKSVNSRGIFVDQQTWKGPNISGDKRECKDFEKVAYL